VKEYEYEISNSNRIQGNISELKMGKII